MTYKIEEDVPSPPQHDKYPWPDMTPGDSVFIPADDEKKKKSVGVCAGIFGRRRGWMVITRSRVEDGISGVRVWFLEGR